MGVDIRLQHNEVCDALSENTVVRMDMKACRDGRYKRSKQCYCVLSRVSCLLTLSI